MGFALGCEGGEVTVASDGRETRVSAPVGEDPYPWLRTLEEAPQGTGLVTGTLAPIGQLVACLEGDSEAIAANAALRADILLGQRIAFAMVQSSLEGGRVVQLDEVDPSMRILAKAGANFA
jgi:hypothetical protein